MTSSAGAFSRARPSIASFARAVLLDRRLAIFLCLIAIGGSFAAASALQMRIDRAHALAQAAQYEKRRANDLATFATLSLDRIESAANALLQGETPLLPPGVHTLALYDGEGIRLGALGDGTSIEAPPSLLSPARRHKVLSGNLLAFPSGGDVAVAVIDTRALVPERLLENAGLFDARGEQLAGIAPEGEHVFRAQAGSWPLFVKTGNDEDAALAAWRGAIPLYLFEILGPALAAALLAPVLVNAFERRRDALRAVKALRAARPSERALLVRLAHAERRAQEGLRAKTEFIAHMSHELRTPLNAVIGFAEVIEKGLYGPAGNPKYVEYAHDIAEAGRGLHARIGDILEYANIEAGRQKIAIETVELVSLARSVVSENEGRAFARKIALELVSEPDLYALADLHALRRALSLLVENSLAYARDEGRIRVEARKERDTALLVVRDIGVGFSKKEKEALGQAFVQFAREGRKGGVGLGLAIATALVHRMGGVLIVGGYHGLGATVEIRLAAPPFIMAAQAATQPRASASE